MKDIKVVVKKMTRNRCKMIKKMANSLLCPLHSIQFLPLFSIHSSMELTGNFLVTVYERCEQDGATHVTARTVCILISSKSCYVIQVYFQP